MNGEFKIDRYNAKTDFGIVLGEKSYSNLLTWAKYKSFDINDWAEEDGIEPDLADTKLDTRTLTLYFIGKYESYLSFLDYLKTDKAYFTFTFPIGLTYTLRPTDNSLSNYNPKISSFSIDFADDFPTDKYGQIGQPTNVGKCYFQGVAIDGFDLSEYSANLLDGTFLSLAKMPNFKQRLVINNNSIAGAIADNFDSNTKELSVTLKILCRGETLENLWANYFGLLKLVSTPNFNILGAAEEHKLYIEKTDELLPFYYDSQSVEDNSFGLFDSGLYGIVFSLTLILTSKISSYNYLTDDNFTPLSDEDEEKYIIQNYR